MIDLHSHLFPSFDDGAADLAETRSALQAFQAQGAKTVLTTPHLSASVLSRAREMEEYFERYEAAWGELSQLAAEEFPDLKVLRGVELMLDSPTPNVSDQRVRLAGTNFVLIEFPFMTVPPGISTILFQLRSEGWRVVIAHPERYVNLTESSSVMEWRGVGAYLQVNAGSLLGRYGPQPKKIATSLLNKGWIDYLASDYHARGPLRLGEARATIEKLGGATQARLLLEGNPARLLDGLDPEPVPALEAPDPGWKRFFGRRS